MKEIKDAPRLNRLYETQKEHFRSRPEVLRLLSFEKGELLNDPMHPLTQFLIIVQGQTMIYGLTETGAIRYVAQSGKGTLLGDVEFCDADGAGFYTEALDTVLCLAVPFEGNRPALDNDPVFLRYVMQALAGKLSFSAMIDVTSQTLEEKLLLYLEKLCPTHEMDSVNDALRLLHCSRRQLQRVLKDLCGRGMLVKTGKGRYHLAEGQG